MKRKLTVLVVALAMTIGGALTASAWYATNLGDTSGPNIIDAPGTVTCPSGTTWQLRSYTYDFGPLDSTGTTQFGITVNGVNHYYSRTGEHDGFVWRWDTPFTSATYFKATYSNMWGYGTSEFHVYCG